MFKEVSRIKQRLDMEESKEILEKELRGVLSVNSLDGYPYCMPLNHYYLKEENRLYFHSSKHGYKIDCIKNDNRCSYSVIDSGTKKENDWALVFKSVIVFGKIHFIENKDEIAKIARLLSYKFTDDDKYIDDEITKNLNNTAMFYIEIEHITGKRVIES